MRIVIVGAGVLGASAAYHLSRAGTRVVVVDAGLAGRATAAGAGIICPWVSGVQDEDFYRLYAAGGEYYEGLIAQLTASGETELGYRRAGAMVVSRDARELDWIEALARRRRAEAPAMGRVTRVTSAEAQALFPPLGANFTGVLFAGGARVDGRLLAAALLRAAQHHGATVLQGHAELLVEGGRVQGVEVFSERANESVGAQPADGRGEQILADRVVVTAGAWADQLLRPLDARLPSIQPQRGQIVHLRLEGIATENWPVILPPGSHYIVPFDGGRIVAGATRESGAGFDYRVTAAGQAEVLSEALGVAPGLATATMIETRVGFRPVGADLRPMLGWVSSVEGLAVGNGLGAAGLTIGPLAGRLLADLVMDRPGALGLEPFDPMQGAGEGRDAADSLR
jgi:D-amino-acid dehydrogenase